MILKIFVAVLVCTGCINLTFGVSKQERKNGETTTFLTSSEFNITKVWLRVLERDFITFKVRACSDVNVALLQFRFDEKVGLTRVVIGGWKNRRSVIRGPAGGGVEVAVWTPGILSCQEFRAFWISWRNETLKVGRGPVYNQNIFMQMSRTGGYAHKINDVGFSTGWGSSGTWTIRENVGVELFYTTPKTYSFSQLWKSALHSNGFLAFRAMACSDVHVAVARGTGVFRRQAYEFVFGGWSNTKSAIRTRLQGEIRAEVHFNDLLNCTEFRDLWVSWKDGLLAMGRGSVYMRDVLVTYNHTRPRQGLSGVGFSTGWGLDGVFSLNQDLEATYLVNTPPFDSGYRTWLLTPRASYVTFSVQVCRDAWVAVTHIPKVPSTGTLLTTGGSPTRGHCCLACETQTKCDTMTFLNGECRLYQAPEGRQRDCPSVPKEEVFSKRNLVEPAKMDLQCPKEPLLVPFRVAALPDGGALISDNGYDPARVYHVDTRGLVLTPWYTHHTSSMPGLDLLVHEDVVYISHKDGLLVQVRLGQLNVTYRTINVNVGFMRTGCVLATNMLLMTDRFRKEIFSINTTSVVKTVLKTGFTDPVYVARVGQGAKTMYVVVQRDVAPHIKVFDKAWRQIRSLAPEGTGDGQISVSWQAVIISEQRLLVGDYPNLRVSEFNLTSGVFLGQRLTSADGIGKPLSLSMAGDYLWVVSQVSANAIRFTQC